MAMPMGDFIAFYEALIGIVRRENGPHQA